MQQKKEKKGKKVANREKLKTYLDMHGIKYKWFAEQLDVSTIYFYRMMQGERPIPKKFWEKITYLTKGMVIYGGENDEN